jgi:hypothetical protein
MVRASSWCRSPNQVQAVADRNSRERTEGDGDQQDDALEQRLPQRIEIEHEQQVADGAEREGAEDRADGAAPPPNSETPPSTTAAIEFSV